jgi:nucleoside-diphosphate kinase
MNQKTVVMLKPDVATSWSQVHRILAMLPRSSRICATRLYRFTKEELRAFYAEHVGKPYYEAHEQFMLSGPVLLFLLEGYYSVREVREMIGPTDPEKARVDAPNSVRAVFGTVLPRNAIHASDSVESAAHEAAVLGLAEV